MFNHGSATSKTTEISIANALGACIVALASHAQAANSAHNAKQLVQPGYPPVTIQPQAIGEVGKDVLYTPIPPCRVFDTRASQGGAGPLVVSTPRTYRTNGDLSTLSQGGASGGCGIPLGVAAVQLQMSPVFPAGFGWITGNAQGQPISSSASLFTFNTGDLNTTSIALVLNQTNGQFTIQANNTGTELVGDAVGYYAAPSTTGNGLRVIPTLGLADAPNIINGSANNSTNGQGATVAGGGYAGSNCFDPPGGTFNRPCGNRATDSFATVGGGAANFAGVQYTTIAGGRSNTAGGVYSTVAGGNSNTATGPESTVAGGVSNIASTEASTVAGGANNTASGDYSTVAGGRFNTASGFYSFAAGFSAQANAVGCFVFGDNSTSNTISCDAANRFVVRALGGTFFYSGGTTQATYTGVGLAPGATAWTVVSDRNLKENVQPVDGREVLRKLMTVPLTTWNLKTQDRSIRHLGPMAQDFKRAFNLGESDTGISTVDADGVAFAAIQGLHELVNEKDATIDKLERANQVMQEELAAIKRKLGL